MASFTIRCSSLSSSVTSAVSRRSGNKGLPADLESVAATHGAQSQRCDALHDDGFRNRFKLGRRQAFFFFIGAISQDLVLLRQVELLNLVIGLRDHNLEYRKHLAP